MNCFPPAAAAAEDEAALLDRNGTRIFRVGYIRVDRYEKEKKKERRKCNELMYFPLVKQVMTRNNQIPFCSSTENDQSRKRNTTKEKTKKSKLVSIAVLRYSDSRIYMSTAECSPNMTASLLSYIPH